MVDVDAFPIMGERAVLREISTFFRAAADKVDAACRQIAAALLVAAIVPSGAAIAEELGTVERLRDGGGALTLGYRTDAAPFAYEGEVGPQGYSVEICRAVGAAVARAVAGQAVEIVFKPVSAQDRFNALASVEIDILCGATTITMERREAMDFTLLTYVTGGVLLVRKAEHVFGGVASKIGVLEGTTSESALNRILALSGEAAEVVTVASHDEGAAALQDGALNAYFGDRALLARMMSDNPGAFSISEEVRTYEPYALAMRRGDSELRLLADRAIARLYRDRGIYEIHETAFGAGEPPAQVGAMYEILSLNDSE